MNRKIIITSVLGASCLGASALTLNAFAADTPVAKAPAAVAFQQQDTPTDSTPAGDPISEDSDRGGRLAEVLAPLVTDGTLTQAQADAVIAVLQAARPEGGGHGGPGRGHGRPSLDAAATALGVTPAELGQQLRDGSTIAEIAAAQGVDVQTVIDALVAEATTKLNEKVAAGELTQTEADTKLATIEERITERVNNGRPERGERPGRGDNADDAADPSVSTTTG